MLKGRLSSSQLPTILYESQTSSTSLFSEGITRPRTWIAEPTVMGPILGMNVILRKKELLHHENLLFDDVSRNIGLKNFMVTPVCKLSKHNFFHSIFFLDPTLLSRLQLIVIQDQINFDHTFTTTGCSDGPCSKASRTLTLLTPSKADFTRVDSSGTAVCSNRDLMQLTLNLWLNKDRIEERNMVKIFDHM